MGREQVIHFTIQIVFFLYNVTYPLPNIIPKLIDIIIIIFLL